MDKLLIDALKLEPKTKKELIEVLRKFYSKKSYDSLRKRVERALSKLCTLRLVEQRGEKYCWYIYVNFLDENYNVKLNHSNKLISALRRIAGEHWIEDNEEDTILGYKKRNDECAESHLVAYPEIFKLLQESQKLKNKGEQEKEQLFSRLDEKVKKVFGKKLIEITHRLYYESNENFVRNNISSLIFHMLKSKRSIPIRIHKEEIAIGEVLVARGSHFFEKIKNLVMDETEDQSNISTMTRIEKIEEESSKIQKKLRRKVLDLVMRINSGEPLKLKCNTCPEVYDLPRK